MLDEQFLTLVTREIRVCTPCVLLPVYKGFPGHYMKSWRVKKSLHWEFVLNHLCAELFDLSPALLSLGIGDIVKGMASIKFIFEMPGWEVCFPGRS